MAAMDDYDSMLEEDGATNRLQESLELFTTVTGSAYFADKGWILFLNKKDLFQKKIKEKPLNKYFSDIDPKAGSDYDKSSNYLLEKYKKVGQSLSFLIFVRPSKENKFNTILLALLIQTSASTFSTMSKNLSSRECCPNKESDLL
jgi:hypothetical protein